MISQPQKTTKERVMHLLLRGLARSVLWRHQPRIIGITGSIGKTSLKDALGHVLRETYDVRVTQKNYNNEIGLPLTILGADAPGHSIKKWIAVLWAWCRSFFARRYPKMLVLEYGIDYPGDMDVLLSIARPHIAVLTHISSVHQEFFEDIDAIAREKAKLPAAIHQHPDDDTCYSAVYNYDEKRVMQIAKKLPVPYVTYGMQQGAEYFVSDILVNYQDTTFHGLSFKVNHAGQSVPIRLPHVIARHHIYAILGAIAVASMCKMHFIDIAKRLESYVPPVGRMRYLKGKNGSVIIDDTYNASPVATQAALMTLKEIAGKRKIAILGDMLELGALRVSAHCDIVKKLVAQKVSPIIFVGVNYKECLATLEEAGYVQDVDVFICRDAPCAGRVIKKLLKKGDVILVKGSQGMRMEKVVEQIVHHDVNQKETLCRQDDSWKAKSIS